MHTPLTKPSLISVFLPAHGGSLIKTVTTLPIPHDKTHMSTAATGDADALCLRDVERTALPVLRPRGYLHIHMGSQVAPRQGRHPETRDPGGGALPSDTASGILTAT